MRNSGNSIALHGISPEFGEAPARPVPVAAIVLMFVLGVGLALGWMSGWLPAQLSARQVALRGNVLTPSNELIAAYSGAGEQNIGALWLRTRKTVPEGLRWVSSVKMHLGWDRRVTLQVEERRPLLLLEAAGTRYWLCDDMSMVPVSGQGDETVAMTVAGIPPVRLPQEASSLSAEQTTALITAAACSVQLLQGQVQRIELDKDMQMSLLHKSGLPILLGNPEQLEEKIGALPKVLRTCCTYMGKLRYIDARDPHVFYEKWKQAPGSKA